MGRLMKREYWELVILTTSEPHVESATMSGECARLCRLMTFESEWSDAPKEGAKGDWGRGCSQLIQQVDVIRIDKREIIPYFLIP